MSKASSRNGTVWWMVALIAAAVLGLVWWLRTPRVEAPAPPASEPGARMLGEAPAPSPGAPEITEDEKAELGRILRERAGKPGAPGGDR